MGITTIKRIENGTGQPVRVVNVESPSDLGSGQVVDPGLLIDASMWVPWCGSASDYALHHMRVEVGGATRFGIWQAARGDGDFLRFNGLDQWADPGSRAWGFPDVNGERVLIVNADTIEMFTSPATIPDFPPDLQGRHHAWHHGGHGGWPARNIPAGQPGSGDEFLSFHSDFVRDVRAWLATRAGSDIVPWTEMPAAMKAHPDFGRWANDYQRLASNDPPFESSDALGIFIEKGIHNEFLHGGAAYVYGEPLLNDPETSPLSAYFYKLHGLVEQWSKLWSMQNSPFGNLDSATAVAGGVRVTGWAIDPNTVSSVDIQVYLGGVFAKGFTAALSRPDVAAAYPGYGDLHGFDVTLSAVAGIHEVCVYAINVGPATSNPNLGCAVVAVKGKEKDKEKDAKEDDKLRKEIDKARSKEMDMVDNALGAVSRLGGAQGRLVGLEALLGTGRPFIRQAERPSVTPAAPPADAQKPDKGKA